MAADWLVVTSCHQQLHLKCSHSLDISVFAIYMFEMIRVMLDSVISLASAVVFWKLQDIRIIYVLVDSLAIAYMSAALCGCTPCQMEPDSSAVLTGHVGGYLTVMILLAV